MAALVAARPAPAAASSLRLSTTASPSTTVGYRIFANANLHGDQVAPTGTVTFRLYGPGETDCTTTPIFTSTVPVTSTSVDSESFFTTAAGTYSWTSAYSGDPYYHPAGPTPCHAPSADVVVAKKRNVLRLVAQPADGTAVRATASLSGYEPTGWLTFDLHGPDDTYCGQTPVFTSVVPVLGAGEYLSGTHMATSAGTYRWRARYSGDDNNQGKSNTSCWAWYSSVTVP